MYAYVEARKVHPEENDFLVVSLGTGELTRNMPYEEVRGWGLALWAQPILNVVFDGVADTWTTNSGSSCPQRKARPAATTVSRQSSTLARTTWTMPVARTSRPSRRKPRRS
jgi:hypothetical protein